MRAPTPKNPTHALHPQQYGSFFPQPNGQRAVKPRPTRAAPDPPSMWSSPPRHLAQGSPPKENRHLFLTISLHLDFYPSTLFIGDIPPLCFFIRYTSHHIGFVPTVHLSLVEIFFFAVGAFHSLKNSFRFFSDAQKGSSPPTAIAPAKGCWVMLLFWVHGEGRHPPLNRFCKAGPWPHAVPKMQPTPVGPGLRVSSAFFGLETETRPVFF